MAEVKKRRRVTKTVCDACLRACCWKGIFMCDKSLDAGTIEKSPRALRKLNREHSDYWDGTYEKQLEKRLAAND